VVGLLVTILVSLSALQAAGTDVGRHPPNSCKDRDILWSTAVRGYGSIIAVLIASEWLIGGVALQT